jgi:sugar-phosphatase
MAELITCGGLLFDLDGVLIDSTPAVARVWRRWATGHGFDPEEVVSRAHGRPSIDTIRDYLTDSDHHAENCKIEQEEVQDLEGVVALPGVTDFLSRLPKERWTIVTSCTRRLAEVRIRATRLPLPECIITADEITRGKPHPEPYLKGADLLGIPPSELIVVEDVPAGIRAGKAAGMRVIAVGATVPRHQLRNAGADWIVSGCSDLHVHDVGPTQFQLQLGNKRFEKHRGRDE